MLFVACAIWGDAFVRDASAKMTPTGFQKTMADMPMSDRQKIAQIGYEPYLDSKVYTQIMIVEAEKLYQQASRQLQHDKQHLSAEDFCNKYPGATGCPSVPPEPQTTTPKVTDGELVGYDEFDRPVYASKTAHNQPCTPPKKDNNFSNILINSGKWAESDPAFEKATSGTLRVEGGFAPFSQARGGDTKYGITKKYNPDVDIENLTPEGAQDIMYETYYSQQHIYKLPDYVRGTVFDMNFMSPKFTWPTLCKRLGAKCEDYVTDEMAELAEKYPGDLVKDLLDDYQIFFEEAATRGDDGPSLKQGWLNRVKLLRTNGCHYPTKPEEALYRPDSPKHND